MHFYCFPASSAHTLESPGCVLWVAFRSGFSGADRGGLCWSLHRTNRQLGHPTTCDEFAAATTDLIMSPTTPYPSFNLYDVWFVIWRAFWVYVPSQLRDRVKFRLNIIQILCSIKNHSWALAWRPYSVPASGCKSSIFGEYRSDTSATNNPWLSVSLTL